MIGPMLLYLAMHAIQILGFSLLLSGIGPGLLLLVRSNRLHVL